MKWPAAKMIIVGFVLVLLILGGSGAVSFRTASNLFASIDWVDRTHRILERFDELLGELASAESAQRGYVITGKESYLESYNSAANGIGQIVTHLRDLIVDETQQRQLREVELLIRQRLGIIDEVIRTRREAGFEAAVALVQTDHGKKLMDQIRHTISLMDQQELNLLDQRARERSASLRRTVAVVVGAGLLAIVLLALAGYSIYSDLKARRLVAEKTKEFTAQLEQTNRELTEALANVKTLSGLLPICAHCKKIRDDKGYWNQLESYIHDRSDAEFSHGICPECAQKYYPELYRDKV